MGALAFFVPNLVKSISEFEGIVSDVAPRKIISVDRILDPESPSTLRTFAKAARALGRHLKISWPNRDPWK